MKYVFSLVWPAIIKTYKMGLFPRITKIIEFLSKFIFIKTLISKLFIFIRTYYNLFNNYLLFKIFKTGLKLWIIAQFLFNFGAAIYFTNLDLSGLFTFIWAAYSEGLNLLNIYYQNIIKFIVSKLDSLIQKEILNSPLPKVELPQTELKTESQDIKYKFDKDQGEEDLYYNSLRSTYKDNTTDGSNISTIRETFNKYNNYLVLIGATIAVVAVAYGIYSNWEFLSESFRKGWGRNPGSDNTGGGLPGTDSESTQNPITDKPKPSDIPNSISSTRNANLNNGASGSGTSSESIDNSISRSNATPTSSSSVTPTQFNANLPSVRGECNDQLVSNSLSWDDLPGGTTYSNLEEFNQSPNTSESASWGKSSNFRRKLFSNPLHKAAIASEVNDYLNNPWKNNTTDVINQEDVINPESDSSSDSSNDYDFYFVEKEKNVPKDLIRSAKLANITGVFWD